MNRQIRSFTRVLPGLLPLLLAGSPALAATDLPTGGVALPGAPPANTSPVQYPFASVNATEYTNGTQMGDRVRTAFSPRRDRDNDANETRRSRSVVRYHIHFKLNPASDGLAPPGENTLLSAAPDPNAPQAAQLPLFQVSIPNGCFVDMMHNQRHYDVNGLGCGVEVRLHDPNTTMDTSLNDYVRHFMARITLRRNGVEGELRINMSFAGFNATQDANPNGVLNLALGNDGVTDLPMKVPARRHHHHHRGGRL